MRLQSIDTILKKITPFFYTAGILAVFFVWWRTCNRAHKNYVIECDEERKLEFRGKISNYSSNVFKATGVFNLNDTSKFYTIPRSAKAMPLTEGDTIIKEKNSNRYLIKKHQFGINDLIKNAIDTFDFDCPSE